MQDKQVILIAGEQCQPECEAKYNKWLDEIHIPMLLKFKGLKEVVRYKIINRSKEYPGYLFILVFENQKAFEAYESSPERVAAINEVKETWKGGGFEFKWRAAYEVMKTFRR